MFKKLPVQEPGMRFKAWPADGKPAFCGAYQVLWENPDATYALGDFRGQHARLFIAEVMLAPRQRVSLITRDQDGAYVFETAARSAIGA